MKISGIYQIQSKIKPERIYIGSAINIDDRWRCHLKDLRKNKHQRKLQNHFNKYGESDLQFSILLPCEKADLIKTEQYFIDSHKPYFNICPTAGSVLGLKKKYKPMGEYQKKRISEGQIRIGNKPPVHFGNKYMLNKHHSEETIKILIELNTDRIVSEETRNKMSKKKIGKPSGREGKFHTEKSKNIMRKSQKNRRLRESA